MRQSLSRVAIRMQRHREEGQRGFSLIELIVVVAVLGILVAIAIPVFGNIQGTARQNAVAAMAANGATQATAQLAAGDQPTLIASGDGSIAVEWANGSEPRRIEEVCVTATQVNSGERATAGPGC